MCSRASLSEKEEREWLQMEEGMQHQNWPVGFNNILMVG